MAASSTVGVAWIWLVMLGGIGAVPAGPPLPLDPVLSAIAPEDCLWYAATSGVGEADPQSANQTEQLFAEPAVQRFFAELEKQIVAAVRAGAGDAPDGKVIVAKGTAVLKILMARPSAAYVEDVTVGSDKKVSVEAAFVLSAGPARAELEDAIKSLASLAEVKGLKTTAESAAGVEWQRIQTPPQVPAVRYGWKGDYLIIAVGDMTPARLLERMGGEAPPWLTQIRSEHPIPREKSIGYLNVAGILERIQPVVAAEDPNAWPTIERLGLTQISSLHVVSGFDETGCVNLGHLVTDGDRPGILGFLPHEPLEAEDLQVVPKDALLALACRLDPSETLEHALTLASQFEPQARAGFEQGLAQVQAQLGVNVRDDIVKSLGNGWVVYLPGGDLMSSWLNTAGAVGVKDAARLRPAVARLIEIARMQMAQTGDAAINESTVGGHQIYTLQIMGAPVPITPSLCITDKRMIVGLSSQAVQAAIDRQPADSLASSEIVSEALSGGDGPAGLAYQDTTQLVRSLYPWVQMGLQMASVELQKQGLRLDASIIPPAETIVKHMRPSVATWSHGDDGFRMTSRGTLPGGGNFASAAPVAVAILLPAVQSARHAARESQEMNNLKMLALAALNYESANKNLPSDIYSDDGKPLLSWRVRVLPYMEEQALYNRFNLDEPWDSPNNRPLMDQLPRALQSPSSPADLGSRTRFLALKGPQTLFPGNQRLRIAQVTDGTSNTLLFVEARPDAAVEWTKPADINFDAERPFAGLAAPEGRFLAAFNDGSVRRISLAIGAETMKALATRNGEEVIDREALEAPSAPHLYDPNDPDSVAD
jgi:hypothetical protein